MTGSCIYIDSFDDGPAVFDAKMVRARSDHTCTECAETIPPGHIYERVRGLWDGDWITYKTCGRCYDLRRRFFPHGFYFTGLVDEWVEHFGFDYREGLPADLRPCEGR